ncbi:hybrid sensor histidine kinase/response regulator [bacterium]|nr:hybrid sensor histidine kinase/response regulator [bacterium]
MTHKKYLTISLFLVLTATVIITVSDYRTALNATIVQSESYAQRTADHLSHQLFLEGDFSAGLENPDYFKQYNESIVDLINSFALLNIKIFNRNEIIVFSLDRDVIGLEVKNNDHLILALAGTGSSSVATPGYQEKIYGEKAAFPMLQTYVPIIHPETRLILGAYEIYQDYRPLQGNLLSETLRSGITHLILLLVFAGLFYRYGHLTSRLMDFQQQTLIRELEDRVEERTVELKRSRDHVRDLLKRKEEMFRNLMIADEYKKNFMGLVSHELRTPLTVIKGYLTMMRDGDLGPVYSGLQDVVGTCLEESVKLESIINNILDLSQLERGVFDLSGEEFDVQELLIEVVDNLATEIPGRKDDIRIEVSQEVANFTSDRIKILQVLQQFLSNALKFSLVGSRITIKASPSHRGLLLSVSDEGVGIPKGQVNEIFNLFYQVDISTTRSYEGSGLGLAIVHKIGQILGGRAWVESEAGVGSTFYFEVKAFDTSLNNANETERSVEFVPDNQPKKVPTASPSILLVDDDEDYLFLLRRILIDGGYTVEMCKDGLEGLNRIFGPNHSRLPSLIVLDIRMPNIHGIDFLKIIRRNMTTREIPVVVASALGQENQVQEAVNTGANAYLIKPFDPDSLLKRINFLLGKEIDIEEQ